MVLLERIELADAPLEIQVFCRFPTTTCGHLCSSLAGVQQESAACDLPTPRNLMQSIAMD